MSTEMFSFKEFESVRLKATYNMKIGDREISAGETIAKFDNILIAGLSEIVERVSANGGFDNRARVYWETTREQKLTFAQGVFSREQFALLFNANLLDASENGGVVVTEREELESDENGILVLKNTPKAKNLVFIYDKTTGNKVEDFELEDNVITIQDSFLEVIIDYTFDYINGAQVFKMGQRLFNGFVELEGRTRIKEDSNGNVITGLIKIPRLRLMSDLSIRLGANANPVVANFSAVGVPVGSRGNTYVSEFYFLNDDIESDA